MPTAVGDARAIGGDYLVLAFHGCRIRTRDSLTGLLQGPGQSQREG
jgi:hypothetical protein